MALANISKTNIVSQVWQNLFELVETIPDPSSRGVQFIFSAFPQQRKGTASVYPCVIIESPDVSGNNIILGHSLRSYNWSIPISIYSTRMETVDSLADSVLGTLEASKGSLEANGMYQLNFTSSPTFHAVVGGNIIHEKRIVVEAEGLV